MTKRVVPGLDKVLEVADDQLWADFQRSTVFAHRGIAGTGREGAVGGFLTQHLPSRFVVTTGEAVDTRNSRSTQLDIVIYDEHLSSPLLRNRTGPELLPAEALLAVVEVKTVFTKAEAETCAKAAKSISDLHPYGRPFIPARTAGAPADDGAPRCLYSILAFESDHGEKDWATKEWSRVRAACDHAEVDVSRIDRLSVLNRGLIVPPTCSALPSVDGKGVLRDWFLHLSDFLQRESSRRATYELSSYAQATSKGWLKLEGYASPNEVKRERRAARAAEGNKPKTSRRKPAGNRKARQP